jgi:hypothetical protein
MKSICLFSSYFLQPRIPYYVRCYLVELKKHFNEVVLITNEKNLEDTEQNFLSGNNIKLVNVVNEGYDFGMWYKAFDRIPVLEYDRIGLINDSCILFKSLDYTFNKINSSDWDYCGILDTQQIAYHIQSFFIIINKMAIPIVKNYFSANGIKKIFEEAINTYEIGISQHLLQNNLKLGSVFSYKINSTRYNPSYTSIDELIKVGFPLIKKKIIFGNYREGEPRHLRAIEFNFNGNYYIRLIKKYNTDILIDFKLLRQDYNKLPTQIRQYKLNVYTRAYHLTRRHLSGLKRAVKSFFLWSSS